VRDFGRHVFAVVEYRHDAAVETFHAAAVLLQPPHPHVVTIDVKKRLNKNLKNVKKRDEKNVCKRNKKRYLFLV